MSPRMDLEMLNVIPPWEWPNDAGALLVEVLHDSEAEESDRLIAAELSVLRRGVRGTDSRGT